MKIRLSVFMLTIALLNLLLGFLNPILCFESDGRIQLEFSAGNQCIIPGQYIQRNKIEIHYSSDHYKTCTDIPAMSNAVSVRADDNGTGRQLILSDQLNQKPFTPLSMNFSNFPTQPVNQVLASQFEQSFLETVFILI